MGGRNASATRRQRQARINNVNNAARRARHRSWNGVIARARARAHRAARMARRRAGASSSGACRAARVSLYCSRRSSMVFIATPFTRCSVAQRCMRFARAARARGITATFQRMARVISLALRHLPCAVRAYPRSFRTARIAWPYARLAPFLALRSRDRRHRLRMPTYRRQIMPYRYMPQ